MKRRILTLLLLLAIPIGMISGQTTITGDVTWDGQSFSGDVTIDGTVTITLSGENNVEGNIIVPESASLTIQGDGTLTVTKNIGGADGTGNGGKGGDCGNITISGGAIVADKIGGGYGSNGYNSQWGDSGGKAGNCNSLTISGGNISVNGNFGGGNGGHAGAAVQASGNNGGGGNGGNCNSLTISGGNIKVGGNLGGGNGGSTTWYGSRRSEGGDCTSLIITGGIINVSGRIGGGRGENGDGTGVAADGNGQPVSPHTFNLQNANMAIKSITIKENTIYNTYGATTNNKGELSGVFLLTDGSYALKSYTDMEDRVYSHIIFNANAGGEVIENMPDQWGNNELFNITTQTPIRIDYLFLGWDTDPQATVPTYPAGESCSTNKDMTLYAIWKKFPKEGDVYILGNGQELQYFAKLVTSGQTDINARLTADIDFSGYTEMIGTGDHPYAGTFDGNGYKITIRYNTTGKYIALFSFTKNATIKKLTVEGSINTNDWFAGGIIGNVDAGITISDCVTNVNIYSANANEGDFGGIVGCVNYSETTITNCAVLGTLRGNDGYHEFGGMVGWNRGGTVHISNSYSTLTLEGSPGSNNIQNLCCNNGYGRLATDKYNYYLKKIGSSTQGTQKTSEQFASGEVAWLLNQGQATPVWGQQLETDSYPVLLTEDNRDKIVYQITYNYNYPENAGKGEKVTTMYSNSGDVVSITNEEIPPYYTFDGWYTKATEGDKVTTITKDETLCAHWAPISIQKLKEEAEVITAAYGETYTFDLSSLIATGENMPPAEKFEVNVGNVLPAGLSIEGTKVTGTPSELVSDKTVSITATAANGTTVVIKLTFTINPKQVSINGEVSFDSELHNENIALTVTSTGRFTVDADDAALHSLTVEPGGTLLTTKALTVQDGFTWQRVLDNKWIPFCTPVVFATTSPAIASTLESTGLLWLKSGYTLDKQSWESPTSIAANTPYLLAADADNTTATFTATGEVTLPAAGNPTKPEDSLVPDNVLLFCANPSLTVQSMRNIYVIDVASQQVVLKEEAYSLQPFEAYFIASARTQNSLKSFSLRDEMPTGVKEVLDNRFRAFTERQTLVIMNEGTPGEMAVYDLSGRCLFHVPSFAGEKRLTGLQRGTYIVRYGRTAIKVIL